MRGSTFEASLVNVKKVKAIDLFCGAGGLTRGMLDSGIEVVRGYDWDMKLKETYEHNNKPSKYECADIRKIAGSSILGDLRLNGNERFFLAACAPCQPFSSHSKGHKHDRRKSLLLQVARIVIELDEFMRKPDFIFLENVPNLAKVDGGRVLKSFLAVLDRLNYNHKEMIINAKDYGVPQNRRRFILMGVRNEIFSDKIRFPPFSHGKGANLLPYETVRKTIGGLPPLHAGENHSTICGHDCAALSEKNIERLTYLTRDGDSRDKWPARLWNPGHKNHHGHHDVYGRMRWDDTAPTLTCKCVSVSNGRFGHPDPKQHRAISLREAALIQTFPKSYRFFGNFRHKSLQIGNAVPVLLAQVFATYLIGLEGSAAEREAIFEPELVSSEAS